MCIGMVTNVPFSTKSEHMYMFRMWHKSSSVSISTHTHTHARTRARGCRNENSTATHRMYTRRTLLNFNESSLEHILFGGCGLPPPVLDWIISYYKATLTNLHIHGDFKVGQQIKAAFKSSFFQMCRFKMSFSLKVVLLHLWMCPRPCQSSS